MSGLLTRRERAGSAGQGDAAVYRPAAWLFLGPLVFLVLLALPLDLEGERQALAAVLGLVVVWWITEAMLVHGLDRRFAFNILVCAGSANGLA